MGNRFDELKGSMKETTGDVLGNERMEAEGKAEKNTAKAERKAEGALDQAKGNTKMAAGKVTGDDQMHAEGQMDDIKGKAKRAA